MFVVDEILIADEVLDAPFVCHLGACHGGCCVHGDSGAPLEPDERAELERVLPDVWKYLPSRARDVIDAEGVWEELEPGAYATTCVDDRECVFVTWEGSVAKCAIQKAYTRGEVDWPKPISCHLYPMRIARYGDQEVLNYEDWNTLCDPARTHGARLGVQLYDFLRAPLTRKYGAVWYERFRAACLERRVAVGLDPEPTESPA